MICRDPEISVVVPFYNEEGNVLPLLEELCPRLEAMGRTHEVIAVDDGSSDGTAGELDQALQLHPDLRVLRLARNSGQTAAFKAGFEAARGGLVVTMDGDLQIDPADIEPMIGRLEAAGVDLVYGRREDRKDGFLKRVSTKIANGVRNRLTGEEIRDTGCPLKVFKREVLENMPLFTGMHRFFITLAHMDGYRSTEMPVRHRPRNAGTSKYGVWNRVFRALRDCLVVRWMQGRHIRTQVKELESRSRNDQRVLTPLPENEPGADTEAVSSHQWDS